MARIIDPALIECRISNKERRISKWNIDWRMEIGECWFEIFQKFTQSRITSLHHCSIHAITQSCSHAFPII